jgi:hypothetical protein
MPHKGLTATGRVNTSDGTAGPLEIIMPSFFNPIASVSNYLGLSAPPQADGDKKPERTTPAQAADTGMSGADKKGRSGAKGWIPRPHYMAVALLGAYAATRTVQSFTAQQGPSAVNLNTPAHPDTGVTFDTAPDALAAQHITAHTTGISAVLESLTTAPKLGVDATWTTVEVKMTAAPELPQAEEERKAQTQVEPHAPKGLKSEVKQAPDDAAMAEAGAPKVEQKQSDNQPEAANWAKSKLNFNFAWKSVKEEARQHGPYLLAGAALSWLVVRRQNFAHRLRRPDVLPACPPPEGAKYTLTSPMKAKCLDERKFGVVVNTNPVQDFLPGFLAGFEIAVDPENGSLYYANLKGLDGLPFPVDTRGEKYNTASAGANTMLVYMEPTNGKIYVFPENQCAKHSSAAFAGNPRIDPAFVGTVKMEGGYLMGLSPWTKDFQQEPYAPMRNFLNELKSRGAYLAGMENIGFGRTPFEGHEIVEGMKSGEPLPAEAQELLDLAYTPNSRHTRIEDMPVADVD